LRDPRALRALAHPLRLELYELVGREGTLTSTQAAAMTGESTASCSFHLRQLAKYGFLEQAPVAHGRERPWRRTTAANRYAGEGPGFSEAAALAGAILAERHLQQLKAFLTALHDEPEAWRHAALLTDSLLYLTAEELGALKERVLELATPYLGRTVEPAARPAGARPVALLATAFPVPATSTGN